MPEPSRPHLRMLSPPIASTAAPGSWPRRTCSTVVMTGLSGSSTRTVRPSVSIGSVETMSFEVTTSASVTTESVEVLVRPLASVVTSPSVVSACSVGSDSSSTWASGVTSTVRGSAARSSTRWTGTSAATASMRPISNWTSPPCAVTAAATAARSWPRTITSAVSDVAGMTPERVMTPVSIPLRMPGSACVRRIMVTFGAAVATKSGCCHSQSAQDHCVFIDNVGRTIKRAQFARRIGSCARLVGRSARSVRFSAPRPRFRALPSSMRAVCSVAGTW